MKLKTISIKNFAGQKELEIAIPDKGIDVSGQNGTGKSTIANAICWLIFDRPYDHRAKALHPRQLKPHEGDKPMHNLTTRVAASIEMSDGSMLSLEKTFAETWSNVKGEEEKTLVGHKNKYKFNSVSVPQRTYNEKLSELFSIGMAWHLVSPYNFLQMEWESLRARVFDLIGGEISDKELAEKNGYTEISKKLGSFSIEDVRADLKRSLSTASKRSRELEVLIQDYNSSKPAESEINEFKARLKEFEAHRSKLNKDIDLHKSKNEDEAERISNLRAKVIELKSEKQQKISAYESEINKELSNLKNEKYRLNSDISMKSTLLKSEMETQQRRENSLELMRSDYIATNKQEFDGDVCDKCNRPLDPEKIESLKNSFFERKSEKLKEIKEDADKCKELIAESASKIQSLKSEITESKNKVSQLESKIQQLQDQPTNHVDTSDIDDKIESFEAEIKASTHVNNTTTQIVEKRDKIQAEIDSLNENSPVTKLKSANEKISNFESELLEVNQSKANIQKEMHELDKLTRLKIESLNVQIKEKFGKINFQMYEEQVNGELRPTCIPLFESKPYHHLSFGEKIKAGLACVEALSQIYNMTFPCIIDEASEYTGLYPGGMQRITLSAAAGEPLTIKDVN